MSLARSGQELEIDVKAALTALKPVSSPWPPGRLPWRQIQMNNVREYRATIGNSEFVVQTGHVAGQAGGALTLREGDTMILATATMSAHAREGIDFFPLSVD